MKHSQPTLAQQRQQIFEEVFSGFTKDPATFYKLGDPGTAPPIGELETNTQMSPHQRTHYGYQCAQTLKNCMDALTPEQAESIITKHLLFHKNQYKRIMDLYKVRAGIVIADQTSQLIALHPGVIARAEALGSALAQKKENAASLDRTMAIIEAIESSHKKAMEILQVIGSQLSRHASNKATLENDILATKAKGENLKKLRELKQTNEVFLEKWEAFKQAVTKGLPDQTARRLIEHTKYFVNNSDLHPDERLPAMQNLLRKSQESGGVMARAAGALGVGERSAALKEAAALLPQLAECANILRPAGVYDWAYQTQRLEQQIEQDLAAFHSRKKANQLAVKTVLDSLSPSVVQGWRHLLALPEAQTRAALSSNLRGMLQTVLSEKNRDQSLPGLIDESTVKQLSVPKNLEAATNKFKAWRTGISADREEINIRSIDADTQTLDELIEPLNSMCQSNELPKNKEMVTQWRNTINRLEMEIKEIGLRHNIAPTDRKCVRPSHRPAEIIHEVIVLQR